MRIPRSLIRVMRSCLESKESIVAIRVLLQMRFD